MPEKEIILKYNNGEKSLKVLFIIHADMPPLLQKIDTCHNDPEKSSTTKINKHTASGYSFDTTKNKYGYYSGKYCMKNYSTNLRKHATKTISYEKKKRKHLSLFEICTCEICEQQKYIGRFSNLH